MHGQWVIRGVPQSNVLDAWWIEAGDTGAPTEPPTLGGAARRAIDPAMISALIALTITADLLFWDAAPGVSVALYVLLLSGCIVAFKPGGVSAREATIAMTACLAFNLPVIEQVQPLSVAFSAAGLACLLGWAAFDRLPGTWPSLILFLRASTLGMFDLPDTLVHTMRGAKGRFDPGQAAKAVALPLVMGLVFLILFASANPLLEGILSDLSPVGILTTQNVVRATFWMVAACAIWPYLAPRGRWRGKMATPTALSVSSGPLAALINPTSFRTSLVLFILMFAVQTVTDLSVLSGGLSLPDGITYAQYAHRGAYPLVVTALLSGIFAIATHHMTDDNRLLRALLLLWLGQNLILVLTAMFRLDLYVDAYTLTYLRVAAFIWMGLVFASLILIVVTIVQARSLGWLIRNTAALTVATLYVCCFINFAFLIAEHNLNAADPAGTLDLGYLCGLGEQAIPAMIDYGQITDQVACGRGYLPEVRFDPIDDWRDWGFRRWRLQRYLEAYHDL